MQAGELLAGGYFCVVWLLNGDLDYFRDCLNQPNATSNQPCGLCPCNTTTMPWFKFKRTASWMNSAYSISQWIAKGLNRCKLFEIRGVTNHSIFPDWMHAKHLGTDKVLTGMHIGFRGSCVRYVYTYICRDSLIIFVILLFSYMARCFMAVLFLF